MARSESKGLGQLARRVSAWTTNSLLTAMLALIALGFGREVLHWWHDEATSPAAGPPPSADPLGDPAAPHVLEFGDQGRAVWQQAFSGPPGKVPAALQAAARKVIGGSGPCGGAPACGSPDAAEQELLKRLAGQRPVAEEPGRWRLYQWGEGRPLLIGTRAVGTAGLDETGQAKAHPTASGTSLAKTPYRVVLWGMAVPASANAWTLYLFPSGGAAGGPARGKDAIPLPPGGHRLLSIRAAGGGAITAFSAEDGDAARGFYERWFAERGWAAAHGWQQRATAWHARYETRGPARAVDIRLGTDAQGRWTGLVMESSR